ncbi:hypothetical protein EVAR_44848_1 [Eumeta japonica]|uniref:Uncharacterized protein n=1 Tax=Eumeta variegata TaxID=151549 RepID=A0A4C1YIQ7_EUMVA|nr:hypothetical protein EVAR_44848_1 [Eumeta japonica]
MTDAIIGLVKPDLHSTSFRDQRVSLKHSHKREQHFRDALSIRPTGSARAAPERIPLPTTALHPLEETANMIQSRARFQFDWRAGRRGRGGARGSGGRRRGAERRRGASSAAERPDPRYCRRTRLPLFSLGSG